MEPPPAHYAFFDLSGSTLTSFKLERGRLLQLLDGRKISSSAQSHSHASEPTVLDAAFAESKGSTITNGDSQRELDASSDAGTDHLCEQQPEDCEENEDEDTIADLLHVETVRKKIEVLAAMVGMGGSNEPGAVLGEVVKVLRELERKAEPVARRSSRGRERRGWKE